MVKEVSLPVWAGVRVPHHLLFASHGHCMFDAYAIITRRDCGDSAKALKISHATAISA